MQVYKAPCGEHITKTVENMISLAEKTKEDVVTTFNEIELKVNQYSSCELVVLDFSMRQVMAEMRYEHSEEGKSRAKKEKIFLDNMQSKCNTLMAELRDLDFTDQIAVLDWLSKFQEPSEYIGIKKYQAEIVAIFREHNYLPGVNTESDFNIEDSDNFARYIVGQALVQLEEFSTIHHMVSIFIDDWKQKFVKVK